MDCADPRTGEHRIGRLRDHGHIDDNAVAFADAQFFQNVGEFADVMVKLFVSDVFGVIVWIVRLPNDRSLVTALGQVPVDTVGGYVQGAVFKPFDADVARREADVFDLGIGLHPIDALAMLTPEPFRIGDRLRVHLIILGFVGMCACGHRAGWWICRIG